MQSSSTKLALVTGANRGIGLAVVKGLLNKGISVILTSRTISDGQKAVEEIASDHLFYHQLDVNNEASVQALFTYVKDTFGKLDILINNAGINYDTWQEVTNADLGTVEETLQTNLLGPWRMSQTFLPLMQQNNYGRIVNVSSGAGATEGINGERPAYSISKAALNMLTLAMGRYLEETNILVNAVGPGWVRTDMGGKSADRSPEEGAETIIWAALLPDGSPTAKFFRDKKKIPW
jgi:NAD(P)-dependent dehydrogenase (short-subunit alcohol dehydrogenase family)